jgi:ABC-2 type transport system permease protein
MPLRTFRKLVWIELKLFLREPLSLAMALAFPLIVQVVMAGVFGREDSAQGNLFKGVIGIDYYTPSSMAVVIAALGLIFLPVRLATYRERGILRRFQASSIPSWTLFSSLAVVTLAVSLAGMVVMFVVALTAYGGNAPESPPAFIIGFLLGALTFLAIGVFLGAALPNARTAQGVGMSLFFLMMFVSGAGPPLNVMPDYMRTISDFVPLTHVVNIVQDPWVAFAGQVDVWNGSSLVITAAMLVVAAALGTFTLRGK